MARRTWALAAVVLSLASGLAPVPPLDDPKAKSNPPGPPPDVAKPEGQPARVAELRDEVKPLPVEPIPDDPPPHERAMIELTYRIDSPDILVIEVLDALPGRPIQGERLVRPDGMVSLGFYGNVRVVGLTMAQAKVKIILHLRRFLDDKALGLVVYRDEGAFPLSPLPPPGTTAKDDDFPRPPQDADLPSLPQDRPTGNPFNVGAAVTKPAGQTKSDFFPDANKPPGVREIPGKPPIPEAPRAATPAVAEAHASPGGRLVYIAPEDSDRVFVDIGAYNSTVYFVQGDVGSAGRITSTGKDTVLDAVNYSGGLLPSADRYAIRLNRPARGPQAAKSYPIDLDAIYRGEAKANLQIFPGDRLIVPSMDGVQPPPRKK